jgi:hypothetical protein
MVLFFVFHLVFPPIRPSNLEANGGPAVFARPSIARCQFSELFQIVLPEPSQKAGLVHQVASCGDGPQGRALKPGRATVAGPALRPEVQGWNGQLHVFGLPTVFLLHAVSDPQPDKATPANDLIWIIAAPQPEASPESALVRCLELEVILAVCIAGLAHFGRPWLVLVFSGMNTSVSR